jgi:hypothetical protein
LTVRNEQFIQNLICLGFEVYRGLNLIDVNWILLRTGCKMFHFSVYPISIYRSLLDIVSDTLEYVTGQPLEDPSPLGVMRGLFGGETIQWKISRLLDLFALDPTVRPELLRGTFTDLSITQTKVVDSHTHGIAAAERSSASNFADRLAQVLGLRAYFIQDSRADERHGRDGSRTYYWAKDFSAKLKEKKLPDNPMAVYIDVDQYVSMEATLANAVVPTFLYTFQPEYVSRVTKNYMYTFMENDTVKYDVTGSGHYEHKVWNWNVDHLMVSTWFSTVIYNVDRRKMGTDRELIFLVPVKYWKGFIIPWFVRRTIKGQHLQRLKVNQKDGFNRLMSFSVSKGAVTSTGLVGSYSAANIPTVVDETLSSIARKAKHGITYAQVQSFTNGDRDCAAVLHEYHSMKAKDKPTIVFPVEDSINRYQFDPFHYDETAKPSLTAFMSPLLNETYAPDSCVNNEVRCIEARVEKVRPKLLEMSDFMQRVMTEFLEKLIPDIAMHTLDPADHDNVIDRQPRPTQRRILEVAEYLLPDALVRSFMKKEPYQKIADPRCISTYNGPDKRDYSRYTYAFETVLKAHPWYAFGRKPADIAERVARYCSEAQHHIVNTDFSRFDGHVSNILRELEQRALMRSFRTQYHEEMLELHKKQFGLKAVATFGTRYEMGFSRGSGSPETSLFNSLANAFVAYFALRMTTRPGSGPKDYYLKDDAWSMLGYYGGDDGGTRDVDVNKYKRAATLVGQELTAEEIPKFSFGVKFLARIYSPYVWNGDTTSCCDLPRQLARFHTTVSMDPRVTPLMKLREKARSYLLTDMNTPILGKFCQKVIEMMPESKHKDPDDAKLLEPMKLWLAQYDLDVQYPNDYSDWMYDYAVQALPDFNFVGFQAFLDRAKYPEDLLKTPLFCERKVATSTVPVILNQHELLPPGAAVTCPAPRPHISLKPKVAAERAKPAVAVKSERPDGKHGRTPRSYVPVFSHVSTTSIAPPSPRCTKAIVHNRYAASKTKSSVAPTGGPRVSTAKADAFEKLKAKKIADGTWRERARKPPRGKRAP